LDCHCFPGHDNFSASVGCAVCRAYEVRLGFNSGVNASCRFCPAGLHFVSSFQPCVACALPEAGTARVHWLLAINSVVAGLLWAATQEDCACELGYYRAQDTCHECARGFFRGDSTAAQCSPCALHTFAAARATVACTPCPPHAITRSNGASALNHCVCEAGYEWDPEAQLCQACAQGLFGAHEDGECAPCQDGFYADQPAQTACAACAPGQLSTAPHASAASCVCFAGAQFVADMNAQQGGCEVCSPGYLSAEGVCDDCLRHKQTPYNQSEAVEDCLCLPGHGDAADNSDPSAPCAPCPSGRFAAGGANRACGKCGFGAITHPALGAEVFEQCMCDASIGLQVLRE